MGIVNFKVDETLRSIVAHAVANIPPPNSFYGTTIGASVLLVKDAGCYLMSAGAGHVKASGKPGRIVAYAADHNPGLPAYNYDFTRSVCGGDDFAELIDASSFAEAIAMGATDICITLTDDHVTLTPVFPLKAI